MPRNSVLILAIGLLLGAVVSPLGAQSFSGSGQQATQLFNLPAGLMVFEFEHRSERGPFNVRLMDERGNTVQELARAEGRFGGSRAIGIEEAGRYLLDVAAEGSWLVRVRPAELGLADEESPEYLEGQEAGAAAVTATGARRWFTTGLAGGALAGPIGAAIAVGLAARSDIHDVPPPPLDVAPAFGQGFTAGYQTQIRDARRRQAFVGGMVGSAVFFTVLIAALEIAGSGGQGGTIDPGPGGGGEFFLAVPVR